MKALLPILTPALMAMMLLSAIQTIEWCTDRAEAVPAWAYIMLLIVGVWIACVACLSKWNTPNDDTDTEQP